MKQIAILIALIANLFLSGCGGQPVGCGAGYTEAPNPSYAGFYEGTYDSQSGSGSDLQIEFTLSVEGVLAGTVTEPSSSRTAVATGRVFDYQSGCDQAIGIEISFTFSGEEPRQLAGSRSRSWTHPWTFKVAYSQVDVSGGHGSGKVTVTRNTD